MYKSWKKVATGKTRMIKADNTRLFQQLLVAKGLGEPLNCLGLSGTNVSLPRSLTDTGGVQLHHTQKSNIWLLCKVNALPTKGGARLLE